MFRFGDGLRGETENIIAYIIYLGMSNKASPGLAFVGNIEQFKALNNRPAFRDLFSVLIRGVKKQFHWGKIIEHIMDYENNDVLFFLIS